MTTDFTYDDNNILVAKQELFERSHEEKPEQYRFYTYKHGIDCDTETIRTNSKGYEETIINVSVTVSNKNTVTSYNQWYERQANL